MLFNRQGLQQKNWRMVKKGKHILFGCSLFFVVGGVSVNGPQVTYAKETTESEVVAKQDKTDNIVKKKSVIDNPTSQREKQVENSKDRVINTAVLTENDEKTIEKKEVNKKFLRELVDKIKNTDISKKTEKSVKELNLVLSRAEKELDNKEVTQEEIDKEVKTLKEVFDKLEDEPREDNKSEVKEKVESKKDEKVNSEKEIKEKQQDNNTEDVARRYNEKITKATNIVKEINSLASEINYEFTDSERELVNVIEKLPTTNNSSEESIQKLLNEAIYLRNRVANRVTRTNSGRRDPRNGKVIDKNGESGFRAIEIKPLLIKDNGVNINSNSTNLIAYNSDDFLALMQLTASKGRGDTSRGFYLVNKVTVTSNILTDLQIQVSTNRRGVVTDPKTVRDINIPSVQAAIIGKIGGKGLVKPGTYQFGLTVNGSQHPNRNYQITYNITIKPQSERNTVKDLSITYVDDVRHLTETEKTALIEKFKSEHPDVVNRKDGLNNPQVDFDHAEISADGTTMTIHFKDGFATKTIQTNATNDVEAKHQSITAYFGDSKELYTNPRQLVRSKTGNEVPSTAQVTYKTPFNLQQTGTRNVVVTTTYENGVTKDVTTPYTVLDFIGKQDKKINQNQSGQLGDARNYITVSDNSALPSELTVRWKGGSSTVDTSAAGVQYKEIEILRGNHLMKTVRIPVEIVDNINPTITAPDSVLLTRLEGLPSEINISAQDNNKGVGLKDGTAVTVENLPAPLTYNAAKSKIEINDVIPNNFQLGKSSIQVTVKAVDKKGNTATKNITFHIQSQTQKYTAVANPQKQEVSYAETPDAGTSIQKNGLPTGTRYSWATKPNTTTGPGDKTGVVTVTYPDGSTDTVNVTVKVRKLSDEHIPTGKTITVNQNEPVTNDRLKAAVTVNNGGTSKVKSVTATPISTVHAGPQTIKATVTYLDNTSDPVDIPLEVKDVTAPTIQTPTDRQNWDLIALDRTEPSIKVTSEDNTGGTGIKSTTVTGLPDFLVYDNVSKTIKFKNGVQEVTKLPAGQDSKIYNVNIQVTDNSNNSSQRQVTITVKSMTTKYTATANSQKQTVSYGQTPNAEISINKNGLPAGTSYTWRTIPNTTTGPGQKAGVVIVTYPDGSTDLVDVNVDVRKLSEEHEPTATEIVKNQNDSVSNADLKAAITISNNGASKVKSVTPVGTINTVEAGKKEITATVTYLDDTTDTVKIPLEVKDVTPPTIQTPANGQNVDLIALDKAFSPIKVTFNDNAGGSGVQSTTVTDLPDFLTYDDASKTIKFKEGTQEVPKLPVGTDSQTYTTTIRVTDNANNSSISQLTFTVKSMTTKYDATANPDKQTVSYGETPDAGTSVSKTGLPEGTSYSWKTTPVTTDGPGEKDGVVEVTYKDGSKDMVNVKVTVKELSSEYEVTGNEIVVNQNDRVSNDDLKAKVTATSKVGKVDGTDKISKVEPKSELSTANYGDQNITATVTFKDGTTKEVTIPLKVKDVTKPTIQTPADNTNWEMTALDKAFSPIKVTSNDNAGGSGVQSTTVTDLPDFLTYDDASKTIKFKEGTQEVPKLPVGTDSQTYTTTIRVTDNANNSSTSHLTFIVKSMTTKYNATPNEQKQTVSYGEELDAGASINKSGLPAGTTYTWETKPSTTEGPGEKAGVVTVTYPDGSKDAVNVTVNVRKLSDEYEPTATKIVKNQNDSVSNEELKAAVTISNNGASKLKSVTPVGTISTAAAGEKKITATVTYLDDTIDTVTIPLEVKDVIAPTIQTPMENQSWDLIALDRTLPSIKVTSEDNAGGSGIKSTTVTGLPDFLEYDEATKTIKFKNDVQEVPKLPEGTDEQTHNITIKVVDNANNSSNTQVTITVKSMTTKYDATANPDKQTVSYGEEPDAGKSVNKTNLPEGTSYVWKTKPETTAPGEKDGVVEVTYKDGSKDTVNVKVTVKELSSEYDVSGTQIEVNQNDRVLNDHLKAKVTAISKEGNINGTDKISKVEPKAEISTANYGNQNITATVTFKDGTTKEVTIPLKVKDVTPPTITAPEENKNWEMTALDKTLPSMEVRAEDNANGSGVKTVSVEGLPDYLEYDSTTNSIKFKAGKQEVEKLPENTPSKEFNLNIRVEDKAGNVSERTAKITVSSMSAKTNPQPIDQMVNYGQIPNPEDSVNKRGLPDGTTVTWKTPPVVNTPGSTTGEVEITYPDGSKDVVTVNVTVRKVSEEYTATGTQIEVNQNAKVTSDMLKGAVNATNTQGENGNAKIAKVESTVPISTTTYGDQTIQAKVTYIDGSEQDVTIPLKVKDVTPPTIQAPTENTNWDLIAVEGQDPNTSVTSEDNAGGSGVKSTTVTGLPNFLEYNESTKKIQFKSGVTSVPSLPVGTDVQPHNVTITVVDNAGNETTTNVTITVKSMTTKYNAIPNEQKQTVSYGEELDAGASINKSGLPAGTTYTWETKPSTTEGPGEKAGVVTVTYPDGSKDAVNVTVNVRKLSDEYEPTATKIVKNQNDLVSNEELKAAVTISNNGASKVKSVTPVGTINTTNSGNQTISVTVTYLDDTTDTVTIPLEVKDVTPPTITAPEENKNWEMTALDKTLPSMEVRAEDNANGSGVKTVSVEGLPDYLEYDSTTNSIKFKAGKQEVEKLPENTPSKEFNLNIRVEDNAGNISERTAKITVSSMSEKKNPTPIPQNTSYGQVPSPNASVDKAGLPEGTNITWKTPPVVTVPGTSTGVVEVTYPDGSKDTVEVTVNVSKLSDEYNVTGTEIVVNQNTLVTNDDLKAKVTARSKVGNVDGTDKISTVTAPEINTANYGDRTINATVTFKDGTTKKVTIPLKVKDVTPPTIQTPANGQNWDLIAVEGENPNIAVTSEDNAGGSGVKITTVTGLPQFLEYNESTKKVQFKEGVTSVPKLSEGTDVESHNVKITVVDNAGNETTTNVTITVKSMTTKYEATANPDKQTVSYGEEPDAGTSVNKTSLPEGTSYVWKTKPETTTPGEKDGIVEVTYKDGSKDIVNVKVTVKELSSEYDVSGTQIEVNQNDRVLNDHLKAKVTAISKEGNINGTDKISKVEPKAEISTANYGNQNITATVTFKDGTTKEVTIPLKVKDVTPPTITAPTENKNWDLIAVEGQDPNVAVTSEDNVGGSGVKSTTVTGLPDFLEYNESTKKIQFKPGVTSVPSLPEGNDVQPHNVKITVVDNAGNETTTNVTIAVKSMTTKYEATPNSEKQTVSYGVTPDAGTSVNTSGLPEGTTYTWKTTPVTTTPGEKDGVVEVTYKDGSKDTVDVKVTVKELSSEYEVTGAPIEVNQNTPVTNDDLKAKVTATSTVGNINGTDKISTVTASPIDTSAYGDQTINATVTFKDGTTKEVTIPLKVKDVTPPTITAPEENKNWEMTALDKTLPSMEVRAEDNANGSGVKTVSVEGLPDYLEYDSTTNSIKFKAGKQEVEKLPENTPSKEFNLSIRVEDKAGNVSERAAKITVSSMSAKTNPQPIDQMVNYGQVPNPEDSVNKQGLPDGTTVTWKTPPVVNTPGSTTGEVEITYPDGSKDVVTVNVTVRKVSEEYTATGTQIEVNQNAKVTSDMLKGAVNATNTQGENGNAKIAKVESTVPISTTTYGDQTIQAKVTYIDGSEQDVTIPLKVKDVTEPTILTPEENKNWEMTALDKTLPVMKIKAEDNANGSGIATIEVRNMPSFLTFDESTGTITFKEGVQEVPKIKSDNTMHGVTIIARDKAGNSTSILVNITVWSMRGKYDPQPKPQMVDNGTVPNAEESVDKTGLPSETTIAWKETPVVNTPGSHPTVALVTYPDGTVDEVTVPIKVKEQKDTYTPTAKQPGQTAKHGSEPSAEGSINTENLPKGTTYTWVEKPDTKTTPGSKPGKVLITYPDNSTEEVPVTVEVTPQKDDYNPQPKPQTVDNGTVPNAEDSVDKTGLPEGTTVTWKTNPDVSTPGSHPAVALVTYPDGTVDEVTVPITVKEQKDTFNPTAKQPGQTAKHGSEPSAEGSINTDGLPKGTTYTWVEKPDTNTTPGSKPGKVLITYPDNSTEEVTVTVEVTPQKDDYEPKPKPQMVDNGTVPNAEESVDKTGLPSETTIAWKETPVVNTPGSHPTVALVTYPDGTVDEVTVPIKVKEQKDTYTPTAKQPGQTAKHGSESSAEGSINTDGLPKGTTYTWVEKPDTNTTPGSKPGKVLITYPDNSTEEVTVTVEVTPQKDDYEPKPKPQMVDNGTVPNAEESVDKTGLPSETTIAWKETPVVNTPGSHPTVALVTYPDGTVDEVTVPIKVKEQKDTYTPTAKQPGQTAKHGSEPSAEGSINTENLPKGTTYTWVEKPDTKTTPGSKPGKVLITYPDNSTEEVPVTVEVTPQKDDYNPQPKPQMVDNGTVPNAEESVDKTGLPEGTTVTWKTTPEVSTPGSHPGVALVHYPDGTEDEVEVPIIVKKQSDTFNPTAKQPGQTAKHGSEPSAEGSINTENLPKGTTYKWVEKPDTNTTPGSKPGKVLITYPDNSTEEVSVTVEVTPQKDDYDPQPKPQTVNNGTVPNAEDSVDKTGLPEGTTVTWKTTPDVSTPGSHPTVALVTYPDGTVDEVTVPIKVKEQKDTFNPTPKQPGQTAKHGSEPSAEGSINTENLPKGTTYTWVEKPDTNTTPGSKPGKVLITYPDNSTEEVTVTVEVTPQKDDYDPQPKPQTVDNGTVPNAEESVDKTGLPEGTTVTWKTTPDVSTPGSHPGVALVHYPDGTEDEVTVPVTVKKQSDTFTPTAKEPNQTVRYNEVPDPEKSINTNDLPAGTKYSWSEQPDTSKPGSKTGKVLITYPDKSTEEVTVTVNVTPQKDEYTPTAIAQEVDNGHVPDPEASVNKTGLPEGTTVTWKTTPDVSTPGSHPGVALVHYPDGTEDEVEVPVVVRHSNEKGIPEVQPALPEFNGGVNGEPEVQPALPEFAGGVNGDPEEQPALPEFNGGANGEPEVQPALPEFNGGANGEPEVQPVLPEFNGGVNGESEIQQALPEFNGGVNGEPEVQPTLPEFAGGVNGEPEVQPALPEFSGGVNGDSETPEYVERINDESKVQPIIPNRSSKITKRLANTGETTNNSELAGLGLAIVGLFVAIKRRKNDED